MRDVSLSRRHLVVGNWKMNGLIETAQELTKEVCEGWAKRERERMTTEVILCPPFTSLVTVHQILSGSSIKLGAQNMHHEESGAYTGEISGIQLRNAGCRFVILGHSERRHAMGESDTMVSLKINAALRYGLIPILCVGETAQEREQNKTLAVVQRQLDAVLNTLTEPPSKKQQLVVAYEPVWAIGTGCIATSSDAQQVCAFVRQHLLEKCELAVAKNIRLLYGGSLTAATAIDMFAQPDIDGGLVGGASLKAQEFLAIIDALPKAN